MDLDTLQREHKEWTVRNFGDLRSSVQGALGICEESGELVHAVGFGNTAEVRDAIGDIMLFMMDYATLHSWLMSDILERFGHDGDLTTLTVPHVVAVRIVTVATREVAHAELKMMQGIRGARAVHVENARDACGRIVGMLDLLSRLYGWELEKIISETWAMVSQRNWKTDPHHGGNVELNETPMTETYGRR